MPEALLGSDAVVSTFKLVNGAIEPGAVVFEGSIIETAPRVTQTELDDPEPLGVPVISDGDLDGQTLYDRFSFEPGVGLAGTLHAGQAIGASTWRYRSHSTPVVFQGRHDVLRVAHGHRQASDHDRL